MEHSGAGCSTVDYCEWFKQPSPQAQRQSNLRALVKFGEKGPALVKKAGRELEVMDMHAYPPLGRKMLLARWGARSNMPSIMKAFILTITPQPR